MAKVMELSAPDVSALRVVFDRHRAMKSGFYGDGLEPGGNQRVYSKMLTLEGLREVRNH